MNRASFAAAVILISLANALAAAEPPAAWQLTLRAGRPGAVFDVAETPRVTAFVRNLSGRDPAARLEFEIRDSDGRPLGAGQASAQVPTRELRAVELSLGDPVHLPQGEYLSLMVRLVADGRCQARWHKGFGLLPRREATTPPEQSPFGLLNDAGDWPLMGRLGVRHVRLNWNWNERPLEWAIRYKIANCPLMNEANAFVRGELTAEEYAAFVRESVGRYKGYVRYWQLGNEFDIFHREGPKSYVESQRIGYAAAKAADPNCVIVGGSITELQVRREGFRESLELGLARYCDIYDFHFYSDLATTQNLLDYIHATCKAYHAEKPLWVTETTQVGMFDPDDRNQSEYVFKRFAHLLANDVSVICWHAARWPYPFSADKVQATAIIDYEGFARPSLFAYAALSRELAGTRFVGRRDAGPGVYVLEFARGPRTLAVVWSERGRRSYRLPHGPGEYFVTFPSGKRIAKSSPQGYLDIEMGKSPAVYDVAAVPAGDRAAPDRPVVRVVEGGESKARPEDCLATLVGPGMNQPDPFPGYGGFVGWVSPVRLNERRLAGRFQRRLLARLSADAAAILAQDHRGISQDGIAGRTSSRPPAAGR